MAAHLADWHPWEAYQDWFMVDAAQGGGAPVGSFQIGLRNCRRSGSTVLPRLCDHPASTRVLGGWTPSERSLIKY